LCVARVRLGTGALPMTLAAVQGESFWFSIPIPVACCLFFSVRINGETGITCPEMVKRACSIQKINTFSFSSEVYFTGLEQKIDLSNLYKSNTDFYVRREEPESRTSCCLRDVRHFFQD
jgi:hypothetical protein